MRATKASNQQTTKGETMMTTKRARKGGEVAPNGEFYKGGQFINTIEGNPKKGRRPNPIARYENKLESQRNWCEQNGHGRITFAELDAKRAAEREAERAAAEDCPTGRVQVSGVVLKTEVRDSQFGTQYKMTVKTDGGWIAWGSIPANLQLIEEAIEHPADEHGDAWTETRQRALERGERVTFTATISPSDTDRKFGFFKRPASAVVG